MQALSLTVSNFFKHQPIGLGRVPARVSAQTQMGRYFRGLRETRRLGLRQAVTLAQGRGLTAVTLNSLGFLERGAIKNPEPELLRDLASLYGEPYSTIVQRVVEFRYGFSFTSDPARQSDDVQPSPSSSAPEVIHDAGSFAAAPRPPYPLTGFAATEAVARIVDHIAQLDATANDLAALADAILRASTPAREIGGTGGETPAVDPSAGADHRKAAS